MSLLHHGKIEVVILRWFYSEVVKFLLLAKYMIFKELALKIVIVMFSYLDNCYEDSVFNR